MSTLKRTAMESSIGVEHAAWTEQIDQSLRALQSRAAPAGEGEPDDIDRAWLLIEQALRSSAEALIAVSPHLLR